MMRIKIKLFGFFLFILSIVASFYGFTAYADLEIHADEKENTVVCMPSPSISPVATPSTTQTPVFSLSPTTTPSSTPSPTLEIMGVEPTVTPTVTNTPASAGKSAQASTITLPAEPPAAGRGD